MDIRKNGDRVWLNIGPLTFRFTHSYKYRAIAIYKRGLYTPENNVKVTPEGKRCCKHTDHDQYGICRTPGCGCYTTGCF